jgi:hypothetical protein
MHNRRFLKIFQGGLNFLKPKVALRCAQDNFGGQKSIGPLEKPLEIADYVFCPHNKTTSRTIRISGALIVIIRLRLDKSRWHFLQCSVSL